MIHPSSTPRADALRRLMLMLMVLSLSACATSPIKLGVITPDMPQSDDDGFVAPGAGNFTVAHYPVPGTNLQIVAFARSGQISVCAPGDEVVEYRRRPNDIVAVNAVTQQCLTFNRRQHAATRYEPLRLPHTAAYALSNGLPPNPYELVPGVRYFVDQRARAWEADRAPIAVLPDGRSCDEGLALPVAANPGRWISKQVIKCFTFLRNPAGVTASVTEPR